MASTLGELCALYGGHRPDPKRPSRCQTCGTQLEAPNGASRARALPPELERLRRRMLGRLVAEAPVLGGPPADVKPGLYTCDENGCPFDTDDAFELAMHAMEAHGLHAVETSAVLLPVRLPAAAVCASCSTPGENELTGALRWRRVALLHEQLQAALLVALHDVCADKAGVTEALARVVVGITSEALAVQVSLSPSSGLTGELLGQGGDHE